MKHIGKIPCPIWGEQDGGIVKFVSSHPDGLIFYQIYSPRAGGYVQIGNQEHSFDIVKIYLDNLSPRSKANLSHRVFRHNWNLGLLRLQTPLQRRFDLMFFYGFPIKSNEQILPVTLITLESVLLEQPSAEQRLLTFMQELVWQVDRSVKSFVVTQDERDTYSDYLWAAAACATKSEMEEFWHLAQERGWVLEKPAPATLAYNPAKAILTLDGRLWVEEQVRIQGVGHQGFVAMWFDEDMNEIYQQNIAPAITAAGYEPHRIDDDPDHSDNLVDRILAAIRQSRFVVADFTCGFVQDNDGTEVYMDRGGVYYEAGFAYGIGTPVIYTCRTDVVKHLHFDIRQFNHLLWKDGDEFARKLQFRIERQFSRGPMAQPNQL